MMIRPLLAGLLLLLPTVVAAISYYSFEQAGDLYEQGAFEAAATIFQQLADDNDPRAQYYLGLIAWHGHLGASDPATACDWFDKAANQDHLDAFYAYGNCYLQGRGRQADINQALYLYGMAAEHGHEPSQYRLARLFATGTGGVTKNPERAYIYLFLALRGDLAQSPMLRDSLEAELSETQLQRAQTFALQMLEKQARRSPD